MITPPFISACHSTMESSAWKPCRVGGPTRHGGGPMRRGALFLLPFGLFWRPWRRSHVALELQRDMAGAQYDVAHSFCPLLGCFGAFEVEPRRVGGPTRHGALPTRRGALVLLPFWAVLASLSWSHVALEAQHDMAGAQCDVAHSFCSLLGCFGPFGTEPRRVGGPTRHGRVPIRHGQALMRRGRAQYNATRLFLGTSTKKPPPN